MLIKANILLFTGSKSFASADTASVRLSSFDNIYVSRVSQQVKLNPFINSLAQKHTVKDFF